MTEPLPEPEVTALEAALGHRFADRALLESALAHSSLGGRGRPRGFDRLEFLGDRVLGLVVADLLLSGFPDEREGELGRRFAVLVSAPTLAALGAALDLGRHLSLGRGQERELRASPAVLADAFEAVLGALYRDGGLAAARGFLARVYADRLASEPTPPRDPKNALQEWTMARGLGIPGYRLVERSGSEHAPRFRVEASAHGRNATGEGGSKQAAERAAAEALFAALTGGEG